MGLTIVGAHRTAAVGATVTITGSAFAGATAVSFGGTPAGFTVAGYGSIAATVPGGAVTGIRVTWSLPERGR